MKAPTHNRNQPHRLSGKVLWLGAGWIFLVCLLAAPLHAARVWEKASAFVNDFANVIDDRNEREINNLAQKLEKVCGVEMAVVTVTSFEAKGYGSVEEAAVELFANWGIGKKGEDNGLLVLVAAQERKWRIEVGYGLEGDVPDAVASQLGRTILPPQFRQGQYGEGLLQLCTALAARIAQEKNIPLSQLEIQNPPVSQVQRAPGQPRSSGMGGVLGAIFSAAVFIFILQFAIRHPFLFLFLMMLGSRNKGGHLKSGSHFGGGGSFGGGFGGFGGGSSGGGGASGGW